MCLDTYVCYSVMNQECIGLIGRNFFESAAIEDANPLNSICQMPLKRGQRAEYMSLIIGIVCLTTGKYFGS